MKKLGKILAIFLLLLIAAVIILPIVFKDKIKELVLAEFEKSTEATLYFDDFDLSLIKNFPDFTLSLTEMGIIGKGVFEGDTLMSVGNLGATVDLGEVLFGESISLKTVDLNQPEITIIVLEDGTANYDIAKETESADEPTDEASSGSVSFGINSFSIEGGEFIYFDQSLPFFTQLGEINVSGKGDFEADIFDLMTDGSLELIDLNFDGTDYVTDKNVDLDVVLSMDLTNSKYTFKENEININSFPIAVDGYFALLEEGFGMDLKFKSPRSEFKQLLSLVPGIYTESFDGLESDGSLSFSGSVSGEYSENAMPAFDFALNVRDGQFHYPDLPDEVKNVRLDLEVANGTGVIEDTRVELSSFHIEMGPNPFDANLLLENLRDYRVKADLTGEINLEELANYLPVEGYELKGNFLIDAHAQGVYDSINKRIPEMDIKMALNNGYIKTPDVPAPIEDFRIDASVTNTTGTLSNTEIHVDDLSLKLDGQPFQGKMVLKNPDNLSWDVLLKGNLDLEKLMALYPMEGMALKGTIDADLTSTGKMSDLEAKRYGRIPTRGDVLLSDFEYKGDAIDQPIEISKASASLTNDRLTLSEYEGRAGSTNYSLKGEVTNYLGFALNNEVLRGNLTATADRLLIGEWMTSSTEEEVVNEGEPLEVVRIPENVQFNVTSNVGSLVYNQITMEEVVGNLRVSNGVISITKSGFKMLNGNVSATGAYDSRPEKPTFDFNFGAKDISIPSSFQSVDMIQKLAPITEKMTGLFNTDFSINGALGGDMMPDYSTLSGKGIIQVLQASLGQSDILSGLSSVTKLASVGNATLEKLRMQAEIKEGRLFIKPFDVKIGSYKTTVEGSTGIDGSIDYLLKMNVPAGQVGNQVNSLISSLTGNTQSLVGNDLVLNVGMNGLVTDPKFGLRSVTSANGQTVQGAVQTTVKVTVDEKKEEVKEELNTKVETAKDSANQVINQTKDSLKTKLDTLIATQQDSIATLATDKLGVDKDSIDKKLESVKKKAKGVLNGLIKKKKKKDNNLP